MSVQYVRFLVLTHLKIDWLVDDKKRKDNKPRCIFPEITTLGVSMQFISIAKKRSMGWPPTPSLYFRYSDLKDDLKITH